MSEATKPINQDQSPEPQSKIVDGGYEVTFSDKPQRSDAVVIGDEPTLNEQPAQNPDKGSDSATDKKDESGGDQDKAPDEPAGKPDNDKKNADGASADAEKGKSKVPKSVQRRIDRLTKEKYELKRELGSAKSSKTDNKNGESKTGDSDDKGPQIEDFETWDEYQAAQEAWDNSRDTAKANDQAGKKDGSDRALEVDPAYEEAAAVVKDSLEDAKDKYMDFDDVVQKGVNDGLFISDTMTVAISEAEEVGAGDIVYYLAQNPKESQRIGDLPKYRQAREIFAIERKLAEEAQKKPPKKETKATEPINPLDGNSSLPKKLSDARSQQEYADIRAEMDKERGAGEGWV